MRFEAIKRVTESERCGAQTPLNFARVAPEAEGFSAWFTMGCQGVYPLDTPWYNVAAIAENWDKWDPSFLNHHPTIECGYLDSGDHARFYRGRPSQQREIEWDPSYLITTQVSGAGKVSGENLNVIF